LATAGPPTFNGALKQGGVILGRSLPGADIQVGGRSLTRASRTGLFLVVASHLSMPFPASMT